MKKLLTIISVACLTFSLSACVNDNVRPSATRQYQSHYQIPSKVKSVKCKKRCGCGKNKKKVCGKKPISSVNNVSKVSKGKAKVVDVNHLQQDLEDMRNGKEVK
jgi:hypothetical protein